MAPLNLRLALLAVVGFACSRVAALGLDAPHFNFGGVHYPGLAFLEPKEREDAIRTLVDAGARVIRLVLGGDEARGHEDFEVFQGVYDEAILNKYDATLEAIHRISKGKTKVIIAPHDSHGLRGSNGAPCDAYCKALDGYWMDFYTSDKQKEYYKVRLTYLMNRYESKKFDGKAWSDLGHVILGVDLQNEPWSGVWPIPAGETWICEMAEHLKNENLLGKKGIAVITGGLSGLTSFDPKEDHNWPTSAWKCDAVDVIGIHGAPRRGSNFSAGYQWSQILTPGVGIYSRAFREKLFMVESWTAPENPAVEDAATKKILQAKDGWDQGSTLNFRGIPWIYSLPKPADAKENITLAEADDVRISALKANLGKANQSPSKLDWSQYLKRPSRMLSNTAVGPNFDMFGGNGTLCDAMDGCHPDLQCKNNICQIPALGAVGDACDSRKACQEQLSCVSGECQACYTRDAFVPRDSCTALPATCPRDPLFPTVPICNFCDKRTSNCRGAPCERISDCSTDEVCDWGFCKPCKEGCIGDMCKNSRDCKSGHCSYFLVCDYPPKQKKSVPAEGYYRSRSKGSRNRWTGPGDPNEGKSGGGGPQPVMPAANMHSRGAGESAAKPKATAK